MAKHTLNNKLIDAKMFVPILIYLSLSLVSVTQCRRTRLVGGTDTQIQDYPYQASLACASSKEHICGGTIISDRHILTAAHCFNYLYLPVKDFYVFLGHTRLITRDPTTAFIPEKVYVHPLFSGRLDKRLNYLDDIAIIKLRKTIPFNQFQQKVNLPTHDIVNGAVGKITGWGLSTYSRNEDAHDCLQEMWITVTDYKHCNGDYPLRMYHDQFCGFQRHGFGPYSGDSGGPVVIDGAVVGIISVSIPEPTSYPHLFTNVYAHMNFIRSALAK